MRVVVLPLVLLSAPLAAQDHSGHAGHSQPAPQEPDHCAMGHLPPEKSPPKSDAEPAAEVVHSAMDHSKIDHSEMDDSKMDHSKKDHSTMDHSAMGQPSVDHSAHGEMTDKSAPGAAPESAVPPRALEGPRHAADLIWGESAMAPSRAQLAHENGGMKTGMIMLERLEARVPTDGGDTGYVWDAQGWYGGDLNRFVVKSEGEGEFGSELEDAEIQALYSRAIGPFFDLQTGVRYDIEPDSRAHAVVGVQGLAPYMFHVDGAVFLSDQGDLTARIEGEYDQKITQRLILQPRVELELSAQDIPEREIGAGLTKVEPGLRLRYEFTPEFAPYVGVEYESKLGETADIAKAAGEDPDGLKLLVGLRAWF